MSKPDPAWSLGNEDEFVLEEDETFGLGDLEGVDLPPFDGEPPPPANQSTPSLEGDDPFGLAAPVAMAAAAAAMPLVDTRSTEQPVPRITIHACCDRHEIADIVSGIGADRRLARAEISVEQGQPRLFQVPWTSNRRNQ